MRKFVLAVLAAVLSWSPDAAQAQAWPSKPIKFVLSFGPGSASDAISRILAQELTTQLGQPVVPIHKPGADGSLSGIEVQRSAPDGYTFLFGTNSALAMAVLLRKEPPYNVLSDFTPVAMVGLNTLYFAVNADVPAKTLPEFIAYVRANPGKLNVATGNTYAIAASGLLARRHGLSFETIPYKSEPDAIVDLISGRVHMMVATTTPVYGHVKNNKLRLLAGTTATRNPLWPDVPTMVEAGEPQHPFDPWFSLVGPAGLPADIVQRMNKEVGIALTKPEVREQLAKQGVIANLKSPQELGDYIKNQNEIWKEALKESGVQPQ